MNTDFVNLTTENLAAVLYAVKSFTRVLKQNDNGFLHV